MQKSNLRPFYMYIYLFSLYALFFCMMKTLRVGAFLIRWPNTKVYSEIRQYQEDE